MGVRYEFPSDEEVSRRLLYDEVFEARCAGIRERLNHHFRITDFCDALRRRIARDRCVSKVWVVRRADGSAYLRVVFTCLCCMKHQFHYPEASLVTDDWFIPRWLHFLTPHGSC